MLVNPPATRATASTPNTRLSERSGASTSAVSPAPASRWEKGNWAPRMSGS